MVARGTEELPMAIDISGRLFDKKEQISEIKLTLVNGTSGGMVVSKAALEELAFDNNLLIDLEAVYASAAGSEDDTPESLIEGYKIDSDYNNAFRPDGSPKTSWRDLTEQDIGVLKELVTVDGDSTVPSLENLATQAGDCLLYTSDAADE